MNNSIYLIESVKNHPKLFINTVNNDDHDDSREWTAVAEECKMSITEAQEQWNQLLIEYLEYLRSNQDFSLAKHMDFLQPYFFTIIDHQTIDENELLNAIDSKKIDEINILGLNETKQETSYEKESIEKNIKIEQQTKELEVASSTTSKPNTPPLSLDDISITSYIMPNNNNTSSFTNLTSLELIFLGYAKQLQRMPLPVQLKTKRKIADIMDEAELEMIS